MSDSLNVLIERADLYQGADVPTTRQVAEFVKEQDLTRRSAAYSNFRAALFVLGMSGLSVLGWKIASAYFWPWIWIAEATLLIGANSAVHEAVHGNLYRSKTVNRLAGIAWGLPVMFNFAAYRGWHLQHHVHTRTDGDPEPLTKMNRLDYVLYMAFSGTIFMFMLLGFSLAASIGRGPSWMGFGDRRRIAKVNSLVLAVTTGLLAFGFFEAPRLTAEIWLGPTLVYYVVFAPMIALPEHQGCGWGPASVFTTTRIIKSNCVMRFLAWGGNFHAAHHLVPAVPGQNLESLADLIEPYCAYVERSYLKWHWSMLVGNPFPVPPSRPQ